MRSFYPWFACETDPPISYPSAMVSAKTPSMLKTYQVQQLWWHGNEGLLDVKMNMMMMMMMMMMIMMMMIFSVLSSGIMLPQTCYLPNSKNFFQTLSFQYVGNSFQKYLYISDKYKEKQNQFRYNRTNLYTCTYAHFLEHIHPQNLPAGYQKWWALEKVAPFNMATFWFLC